MPAYSESKYSALLDFIVNKPVLVVDDHTYDENHMGYWTSSTHRPRDGEVALGVSLALLAIFLRAWQCMVTHLAMRL